MAAVIDVAISPTNRDADLARELSRRLSSLSPKDLVKVLIRAADRSSSTMELPRPAVDLLIRMLNEMASGNAVSLLPIHAELSTQEAAGILGVSRPFLVQQMESGEIPFRKIGTHRRARFKDIVAYKRRKDAAREKSLDQLAAQAQELKLGY